MPTLPPPIVVRAFAKLNLTLRVGHGQPSGFHDICTLFQSIALHDTLTCEPVRGPFAIACGVDGVPEDQSNIVWRAALALWRARGRTGDPRDVRVRIDKRIPIAAGLGGGSADAAAALVALNLFWRARLPRQALVELAATLGSDVPFFFHGGSALGVGRGEELFPVDDVKRLGVVLLQPSFGVSAADAYRWCDEDRARDIRVTASGDRAEVGWRDLLTVTNDLEPAVARRHPIIADMVSACRREGAIAAAMTGSGSVVFGLFSESGAKKAARRLQSPDWQVFLTRTASRRDAHLTPRPAPRRRPGQS